jgi:hypothetical protein
MMNSKSEHMVKSSGYLNDGSNNHPKLRHYLNPDSLVDLRADTVGPGLEGTARYQNLLADGFVRVQLTDDDPQVKPSATRIGSRLLCRWQGFRLKECD